MPQLRKHKNRSSLIVNKIVQALACLTIVGVLLSSLAIASINSQQPAAVASAQGQKPQFCPFAKELTKQDLSWVVGSTWKSYNESFVTKIKSFVGAQWIGIRVGKIICLYQGDKSFDFPIALELVKSRIIDEPAGAYWSALVNNHKFCQSSNVFDCPFYVQKPKDTKEIYKDIEYQPRTNQLLHDTDF